MIRTVLKALALAAAFVGAFVAIANAAPPPADPNNAAVNAQPATHAAPDPAAGVVGEGWG